MSRLKEAETYFSIVIQHKTGEWPTYRRRISEKQLVDWINAPDMVDQEILEIRKYEATSMDVTGEFITG